jgi:hypothetical protein
MDAPAPPVSDNHAGLHPLQAGPFEAADLIRSIVISAF